VSAGPQEPLPKLAERHQLEGFRCGAEDLDDWLLRRALKGQDVGNATVFVFEHDARVLGYYALAAAAVDHRDAPGQVRRNAPAPIPVLLLARLAVDRRAQGRGIGRRLLQDALIRALRVSTEIGFRAVLVHCRDESAREYYLSQVPAFVASPTESLHLLLPLQQLRNALGDP
jgi:GNAT superfamily N-acetyltransferase